MFGCDGEFQVVLWRDTADRVENGGQGRVNIALVSRREEESIAVLNVAFRARYNVLRLLRKMSRIERPLCRRQDEKACLKLQREQRDQLGYGTPRKQIAAAAGRFLDRVKSDRLTGSSTPKTKQVFVKTGGVGCERRRSEDNRVILICEQTG